MTSVGSGSGDITPRAGGSWADHFARLQAEHTSVRGDVSYNVVTTLVNAADYGVPQQRWRVFMVGFRSDVNAEWSFPAPTHSSQVLRITQDLTGEYWERHGVAVRDRPEPATRPRLLELPSGMRPWRTVRDAIGDLPEPTESGSRTFLNHVLQPGARSYPGHTGSFIDELAKALKAGVHGVPGGENMLRRQDGSVRYFTVREAARLQTFPDRYALHGPWSEAMRQLGNAVPVLLAQTVAASVREHLTLADFRARWLVIEDIWIPLGESALIREYRPVWNVIVDGFGNHDPGQGRINGVRSRWDTLHPGRSWADKYPASPETPSQIEQEISEYLRSRLS